MTDVQEPRQSHIPVRGGMETIRPADRARIPRGRRIAAYFLAIVLPLSTAAAMIPLRVDHGRVAVLVLVIPVVLVALLGGFGPAIVAAGCAVLAYDVFLVEPYYDLAIGDSDEVVAALTLFGVALIVGVLSARVVQLRARDAARLGELRHLVAFARVVTEPIDDDTLVDAANEHITSLLNLRTCTWQPGNTESTAPILLPDGNLMGRMTAMNPDRATLPEHLEIPVRVDGDLLGRFVLLPTAGHVASYEERATAATIAALFGNAVSRSIRKT
jgi:K+-sensing histidine kinase KdpD